jgi:hypothetical protein
MATLFDLKYQGEEPPVELEEEDISEETDWSREVRISSKDKRKNIVSGIELDVISANLQSLEQQVKDAKIKEKKRAKKINLNCMNALKANEEILERMKQINLTRGGKQPREEEKCYR